MNKRIAIIGYGRIGRVAARFLSGKAAIGVYDKVKVRGLKKGIRNCSPTDLSTYEVIIFALPVRALRRSLIRLSKHIDPGALVVDLCSVKEQPLKWMTDHLPGTIEVLGIHPLFGPDSLGGSFEGKEMIVCPARIGKIKLQKTISFLRSSGFRVTVLTASEHDRLISSTLFLTQFISRALARFQVDKSLPRTENYKLFEQIIGSSNNDKFELFLDIFRYNRYAKFIPAKIMKNLHKMEKVMLIDRKKYEKRQKRKPCIK